jgi:hypothetical protein
MKRRQKKEEKRREREKKRVPSLSSFLLPNYSLFPSSTKEKKE